MNPAPNQQWAIIRYDRDYFASFQHNMCRNRVACVIPMVTEWNQKAKKEVRRPAFHNLAFIPGEERFVQAARMLNYVNDVWRDELTGALRLIPDQEFQVFLDRLERREKKPAKVRRTMNLADLAEKDGFALYSHLFGKREAIRKFGKDLSEGDSPNAIAPHGEISYKSRAA